STTKTAVAGPEEGSSGPCSMCRVGRGTSGCTDLEARGANRRRSARDPADGVSFQRDDQAAISGGGGSGGCDVAETRLDGLGRCATTQRNRAVAARTNRFRSAVFLSHIF